MSKETSKLRVQGLCEGNSPVTGEFPTQRASNAENVSTWWRHHVTGNSYHWYTHYRQGSFTIIDAISLNHVDYVIQRKKLKAVGKIVLNQSHQENMAKRELCVLWKYADVCFINLFRNILVLLCHQQSWQGLSSLRVRIKEHFIPSQCIVKYTVSTPQCC